MKKVIIWIIVLAVIVGGFVLIKNNSKTEPKTIKIGVVAPLTGGAAGYGLALVKGIELAKQDLGDTDNTYKLIFEDDESTPAKSASAASKLINIDKVDAIITTTSGTGNAVKPIATNAKLLHICVCSDVTLADNITNFTYLALPSKEGEAWANEAALRGTKSIAIISQNHPGMNLIIDEMKKRFGDKGITISFEERYDPSAKDFKTTLAKAGTTKPDLYLIGAFPPSLDVLAAEAKTLGITNIGGIGTFAIMAKLELLEGAWFTDVALSDSEFKSRFQKAFPSVRFNARTAPYGYDVLNILVSAFDSNTNPASYVSGLTVYDGKVGHVTKSATTGSFDAPLGIWQMKGGEAVQVK